MSYKIIKIYRCIIKRDHSIKTQIKPFDALQLWAQIYELVKNEDKASCFRLDEEEKQYLEKRNSAFVKPMKAECEVLDILEEQQTPEQGYICTFK